MKQILSLLVVIFFGCSVCAMSSCPATKEMKHKPSAAKAAVKATTTQVICPVTGAALDPAKAYAQTTYKGKTYYFCCAGCPEEFGKNPEKYIQHH